PAVRRPEAPPDDRPLAHQRAGDPDPRRAHHRAGPAGQARGVGPAVPAQAARRHADPDDALHGRGRAVVRPAGGDGPQPGRRPGPAPRPDPPLLLTGGARAALRPGPPRPGPRPAPGLSPPPGPG